MKSKQIAGLTALLLCTHAAATAWATTPGRTPLQPEYILDSDSGVPLPDGSGTFPRVPEGVAYDPISSSFFATAIFGGRITRINGTSGIEETFFQESTPGIAFSGAKVAPFRRILWVCATEFPAAPNSSVYAIRIGSEGSAGTLIRKFDLPSPFFCNDVALDYAGNAYVTNSLGDTIFRVEATDLPGGGGDGAPEPFASSPAFLPIPNGIGLNGIALAPTGNYLLATVSQPARLFRIRLSDGAVREVEFDPAGDSYGTSPVDFDVRLLSPDGLVFLRGDLYVVYHQAIQKLDFSGLRYRRATISTTFDVPAGLSTATVARRRLYVIDSDIVPVTQPALGLPIDLPSTINRIDLTAFP